MRVHFIEGLPGCAYAVEHGCTAIVVDALRASATATMFLDAGVNSLTVVGEVPDARARQREHPEALLYGERGGLPPEGFAGGNSPQRVGDAAGRDVIFTTTTGAGRLVACWGAPAVYMGTTINASAVVAAALAQERDIVVIPAGLTGDDTFDAVEDRAAAAYLARLSGCAVGAGEADLRVWWERIDAEGLAGLFERSPHAEKLRRIDQGDDVPWCAQVDVTDRVPRGRSRDGNGVLVVHAPA